jgi:hypothetical protein
MGWGSHGGGWATHGCVLGLGVLSTPQCRQCQSIESIPFRIDQTRFPGTTEPSPHAHEAHVAKPKILSTILDHIGDTPLVRINKITQAEGIQVRVRMCMGRGMVRKEEAGAYRPTRDFLWSPHCHRLTLTCLQPQTPTHGMAVAVRAAGQVRVLQLGRLRQGPHRQAHD